MHRLSARDLFSGYGKRSKRTMNRDTQFLIAVFLIAIEGGVWDFKILFEMNFGPFQKSGFGLISVDLGPNPGSGTGNP